MNKHLLQVDTWMVKPSCVDHWFDWDSGSDTLDISTAFAKLKSVSEQKCVDRKNKLNAPADPKSFYKWYFEPGNLDKVEDFFRDCRGLADLQTFRETEDEYSTANTFLLLFIPLLLRAEI